MKTDPRKNGLITQHQSDKIFYQFSENNFLSESLDPLGFNRAVNALLMDKSIVRAILKKLTKAKNM